MKTLLKTAREQKGLTMREVSQQLQIDQALVSKFENGQRNPTKAQITKMAGLYGIDLENLMLLWLKEKILREIEGEPLALKALKAAESELAPDASAQNNDPLQKLLDEMDALKHKFENLRGANS